jgi:hypothetical protein
LDYNERKNSITSEFFWNDSSLSLELPDIESFAQKIGISPKNIFLDHLWEEIPENGFLLSSEYVESLHQKQDSIYYGSVFIDRKLKYVWKKSKFEPNPKIIIDPVTWENKTFNVVRDDLLPGGTKQRGHNIIAKISQNEVVYAGPWNGFAQVALSIACKMHKKKATIFMTRSDYKTNIRARMYGGNIREIPNSTLKELQNKAQQYAIEHDAFVMPFGFDSDEFRLELRERLKEALEGNTLLNRSFDGTIWLAAGSATLLNVLYSVFPNAKFQVVQVGKKIWNDQLDLSRTKLYIAPEKFYEDAKLLPPYPHASTYDAKLWRFVIEYGSNGDVIWNVAGHPI